MLAARTTGGVIRVTLTTGGSGYDSPPSVSFSGGGGTGAAAVAHMAGTKVQEVVVTNQGTGYTSSPSVSFTAVYGAGAEATACVYAGALRPMTFFSGRFGDVYGVDGMGRGIRWDGSAATAEPIGLRKPAVGPTVTASSTSAGSYVKAIQVVKPGAGYEGVPTVTISGGSPSVAATAKATMQNGRISAVKVMERGAGYTSKPSVQIGGGIGSGASFSVGVAGAVSSISVLAGGTGYTSAGTSPASVLLHSTAGLTSFNATVTVDASGRVSGVQVEAGGTGATTSGITASITGGGGTGASLKVDMIFAVNSVTVSNGGTGYGVAPYISFVAATRDVSPVAAAATASVTNGSVSSVTVYAGGRYSLPPTATVLNTSAEAVAVMSPVSTGTYRCAVRYLDDTPKSRRGPIASSISELVEVTTGGASGFNWDFTHTAIDDRVYAMELWRTTTDQAVILFRVATILRTDPEWSAGFFDTLSDEDLQDTDRAGYGFMPVTLPSGQVNARRFEVPPGNYAVATIFQDRAWYAVDTCGEKPNSLLYSEVDEPESVPTVNELVVQSNTGVPDKIVGLVPLGSELLVVQQSHIYSLTYVSQPVIDAAITLRAYRGMLNSRCWSVLGGVAFMADSYGVYAFDGQSEEPVSVPVDNYWRDGIVDFSKADLFHVSSDYASRTVRFHYCQTSDAAPTRALCYSVATKAWWEEVYSQPVYSTAVQQMASRLAVIRGSSGHFLKDSGTSDPGGSPIAYRFRSGNMPLADADKGSRAVSIVYTPTSTEEKALLRLYYNGSSAPRPNAIYSDQGAGFATDTASTQAELNMRLTRSALGDATGFARAAFAGTPALRNSGGGDRHIAVEMAGTQSSDQVRVHNVMVDGVQ